VFFGGSKVDLEIDICPIWDKSARVSTAKNLKQSELPVVLHPLPFSTRTGARSVISLSLEFMKRSGEGSRVYGI
jgi:hypothetical protein